MILTLRFTFAVSSSPLAPPMAEGSHSLWTLFGLKALDRRFGSKLWTEPWGELTIGHRSFGGSFRPALDKNLEVRALDRLSTSFAQALDKLWVNFRRGLDDQLWAKSFWTQKSAGHVLDKALD